MKLLVNRRLIAASLPAVMALAAAGNAIAADRLPFNDAWKFSFAADTVVSDVHLPHSWNGDSYLTRNYYRGKGVYTKVFTLPENFAGKQIYLRLDGAASKSEVRIDGEPAGTHVGAYSSHTVDLTPYVRPLKEQKLEITVDNSDPDIPP